jgi:hypothetical protein
VIYWHQVYHRTEDIPFGSMINGEDDANGDMNQLMDNFGWTEADIRRNYQYLGYACWGGLALVYAVFALRLNRVADRVSEKLSGIRESNQA